MSQNDIGHRLKMLRLTLNITNEQHQLLSSAADMIEQLSAEVVRAHGNKRDAVAAEREACALAAEGYCEGRDDRAWIPGSLYDTLRRDVAAAIRTRSAT